MKTGLGYFSIENGGQRLYVSQNLARPLCYMFTTYDYDIHVSVGLPGKIIAFLTSLIGASRPIADLLSGIKGNSGRKLKDE